MIKKTNQKNHRYDYFSKIELLYARNSSHSTLLVLGVKLKKTNLSLIRELLLRPSTIKFLNAKFFKAEKNKG